MQHQLSADTRTCIDNCLKCHSICTETINHCLNLGNEHANPEHIQILMDCAQICQTNADFMLRSSELHASLSNVCKEACIRCANDCEKISKTDELMKQCAQWCNTCAESCAKMAKH